MKLLGRSNGKKVIASISRHDCISDGEGDDYIMGDGGQMLSNHYAGYNRGWGEVIWFEVSQTFAELFNDYIFSDLYVDEKFNKPRKYGVWNIKDVRVLLAKEWPNVDSIEEKAENFIWGTRGLSGHEPLTYVLLKDCDLGHLEAILANVSHIHEETKRVIEYLIQKKS